MTHKRDLFRCKSTTSNLAKITTEEPTAKQDVSNISVDQLHLDVDDKVKDYSGNTNHASDQS